MPDRATYLSYKQDQKLLVYWITRACKDIINTSPSEAPVVPVSTGKVSLATPKALSQLIARHNKRIPTIIYHLFWSIIESRQERHRLFLRVAASNPVPSIQKSNDTHSHWINGLIDVFNILGGDSWLLLKNLKSDTRDEDKEEAIFSSKLSLLSLDGQSTSDNDEDETLQDTEQSPRANIAPQLKKKPINKGKRRTRGRKVKT
ncbi:hypothetical protein PENPOL_c010G03999 [Penicillium polonicum]|uniref:DUF6604 domain-containing protein n=1 Tax=Penicillium polonicum TaxID=60169 RepID=A0A1V6NEF3_PENPO|nr:hypothetical protein PENPOL_c010G03999 [Penicillium polonicum]